MSAARDSAIIESKITRDLGRSTTRMPIVARRAATNLVTPQFQPQKQSWTTVLGLGSALLAIVAAVAFFQPWQADSVTSATDPHVGSAPKAVTIASPTPASTSSVVLPATFRAWQSAALHARASGYLTAWHRDLGSPVKA